jgi:digeranylgeranylglycerophospholipid reductase
MRSQTSDCIVVGASFSGLACATALARSGLRVTVLERKPDVAVNLRTTGILVKEAVDTIPLLSDLPSALVRRIDGVRLYAPNLDCVDLSSPGYYFLATDTPQLMRWLADQAERAGARILYDTAFDSAESTKTGFKVGTAGTANFLVGADGPRSRVAQALGLGLNTQFLFGVEHEYPRMNVPSPERLLCFLDRRLAPGYIGWIVAGVGIVQVGLAGRVRPDRATAAQTMAGFLQKIAPIADFRRIKPAGVRAGMIPCGGLVRPLAARRVLLVGDAAGMVSPLTAGGIHTALRHGLAAGCAVADYLNGRAEDPSGSFVHSYPSFRTKRVLRFLFDHLQSDIAFNVLLGTRAMRAAASMVYFHRQNMVRLFS